MYTFYIDEYVSIWRRNTYNVKADSYEEALDKIKKEYENPTYEENAGFVTSELIYETEQAPLETELLNEQEEIIA